MTGPTDSSRAEPTAGGRAKPGDEAAATVRTPGAREAQPKGGAAAGKTSAAGGATSKGEAATEVDTPLAGATPEASPDGPLPSPAADPSTAENKNDRGWPNPSPDEYEKVIGGDTHDPHGLLGAHPLGDGRTIIRTMRHQATAVTLVMDGREVPLEHLYGGIFGTVIDGPVGDYRLRIQFGEQVSEVDDPYRWLPTLGDIDLHLIGEGRHEFLWNVLGAHVRTYDTPGGAVTGTSFAVWAPSARGVRVAGDFDHWSGAGYPMRSLGSSGVWELFIPGIGVGTHYKFKILGRDGVWREKADPMAFAVENYPATASVVTDNTHEWTDSDWMEQRSKADVLASPMSVYEVHPGSWRTDKAIGRWPRTWSPMSPKAASPTSNSCPWPGTRSAVPGVTRSPPTTPPTRDSVIRMTSATWSTGCTRPGSA